MDTNKARALVEYLTRHDRAVTAKELAGFLNLSVRSVKSYISSINGEAKEPFIISGHSGYTTNPAAARNYLRAVRRENTPQDYEERANWINQKFLRYHVSKLNLYDVAEALNYSADTIRGDVRRMNGSFASFGISYELHGNDICMIADEKSLRKLASYSYFEGSGDRIVSYDSIKSNLDDVDVEGIRRILEHTMAELNLYVNDFSLTNIVLHTSIMASRVLSHHELPSEPCPEHGEDDIVYHAAQRICVELEDLLHLSLSREEQNNVYFLLRANINLPVGNSHEDILNFVGDELMQFVEELIREVDAKYYINLNSEPFRYPFAMHIKNLLFRARHNYRLTNPMSSAIRYSHPMIFDIAVHSALIINETYHVRISEDEISYLALHIGGEIERQADTRSRIRTVLLCPRYLEFAGKISNQLLISFGDEIDLVACTEDPAALERYRYELLITTVALESPPKNGAAVVSVPLLGIGKYKSEIENALDSIRNARRIRVLKSNFDRIFSEKLFSISPEKNTDPAQIMELMARQMIEQGTVQEDFYQRLMEREQASSTGFPNIAIPHSMKMDAIRTSINVMLCPQGVAWGGNIVKIVMMVAIHRTDLRMFGDLYQALLELMDDPRSREALFKSRSFEEFRECILHWN